MLLFLLNISCASYKKPVKITISPSTIIVEEGELVTLTVMAENSGIVWPQSIMGTYTRTSNTAFYMPPSQEGIYEFTVTAASDKKVTATTRVIVKSPVLSLRISSGDVSLGYNKAFQFEALCSDGANIQSVIWETFGNIGTIDSHGLFTATASGVGIVTASITSDNGIVLSTAVNVVVSPLSVGVFGGSISSMPESETAKKIWSDQLNIIVTTYGVGGAGFSSKTANNILLQIEKAPPLDVYILWASSNDAGAGVEVGDAYSDDLVSQNGGLSKSIELIRRKNSDAIILLFTSMPNFSSDELFNRLKTFVDGQHVICDKYNIPCLDLWELCGFNWDNFTQYYLEDNAHLRNIAYASIAPVQINFIRENIQKYFEVH